MQRLVKPIVALTFGAVLSGALASSTALAQSDIIVSQGTSYMADVMGPSSVGSPEALSVSWFVVENTSTDIYTYAYNVNNPAGDVELPGSGDPGAPETFASFSLSFDTTVAGAYLSGTAPVGGSLQNNGANGLAWTFPAVSPGASSPLLAFQSSLAPGSGNATAGNGGSPPAPWSTVADNQPVVVPVRSIPEPASTALLALTLLLVPFRSLRRVS